MATKRIKGLLISSLVFGSISLLFFLIAFSTPHWLEADDRYRTTSGFIKLGLWEACFNSWTYFKDYNGKQYNGCWWIFSYEYRPIWQWLNPPWFLAIQILMTLTLLLQLTTVVLLVLFLIGICPGTRSHMALFTVSAMSTLGGLLIAICMIMFGTKSVIDRQWIENPDKNYLSWSFGLMVMSGFLILFCGMCLFVTGMQVRLENRYSRPREKYGGHAPITAKPQY